MSLNNRDPVEGDNESVTALGLVSGDLVHVISAGGKADNTASESELVSRSGSVVATPSGCEIDIKPAVSEMETDAVMKYAADGGETMEDSGSLTDASDTMLSVNGLHGMSGNNNIADDSHIRADDSGSTGVPYAMSTEELQLINRYLNEPMVVREATVHALPQTLVLAYSLIQPQTADAALLTVLDVLVKELGYQRTVVCYHVKLQMLSK